MKVELVRIERTNSSKIEFDDSEILFVDAIGLGDVFRRASEDTILDRYKLEKNIIFALECLHTKVFDFEGTTQADERIKIKRKIHNKLMSFLGDLQFNNRPAILLSYNNEPSLQRAKEPGER